MVYTVALFNGAANGTPVTSATVPEAMYAVAAAPNTVQHSTADAWEGSAGVRFTQSGSGGAFVRFPINGGTGSTSLTVSVVLTLPASAPSAEVGLFAVQSGVHTATNRIYQLNWNPSSTTGRLTMIDDANVWNDVLSAAQATLGGKFRFEMTFTSGATSGKPFTIKVYNASTDALIVTKSYTGNGGSGPLTYIDLGVVGADTATSFGADTLQWQDGSTTELGKYVAPVGPPVATVTTSSVAVIDARTSTGSGTLSFAISPSAGVTQPAPGLFLIPVTAVGTYTVTVSHTGSSATASKTVTVTAPTTPDQPSELLVFNGTAWV